MYTLTTHIKKYFPLVAIVAIVISLILLTSRCAQIAPLEGGPIDSVAPKLVSTYPIHGSTEFKGKKITLTFDKEIEIKDIYNRLLITPKLPRLGDNPSYTYKSQGKILTLNLEANLEEETTYTFNFKDAIVDTKESTPADNPTLTFSTGEYIDSMYVEGQVAMLMTGYLVKNAIVTLYKITDIESDSMHILNSPPDYFTTTDQEGKFLIKNIKDGRYRICAGYSQENKIILDDGKDYYGFLKSPIELFEPITNITIPITEANVKTFKIQGNHPQGPYYEINFNKPVANYTLNLAQASKRFTGHLHSHLIENSMTIRVYNTMGLLDDDLLAAHLIAEDEMGQQIEKKLQIHFKNKSVPKEPFTYKLKPETGTPIEIDNHVLRWQINFNKPIKKIFTEKIALTIGNHEKVFISADEIHWLPQHDAIIIEKNIPNALLAELLHVTKGAPASENSTSQQQENTEKENLNVKKFVHKSASINLTMEKGAFLSVEREWSNAMSAVYSIKNPEVCGTIRGTIITNEPGFVVQLLNENNDVIDEIFNTVHYTFSKILPGNYRIRVLCFKEKNGKWQYGNIHQLETPDPVIFYPYLIPVVANWGIENIDIVTTPDFNMTEQHDATYA